MDSETMKVLDMMADTIVEGKRESLIERRQREVDEHNSKRRINTAVIKLWKPYKARTFDNTGLYFKSAVIEPIIDKKKADFKSTFITENQKITPRLLRYKLDNKNKSLTCFNKKSKAVNLPVKDIKVNGEVYQWIS